MIQIIFLGGKWGCEFQNVFTLRLAFIYIGIEERWTMHDSERKDREYVWSNLKDNKILKIH